MPSWLAMITVIAAASAMQKARERSSSVISDPTVRISFGPNSARPIEIPSAPITITQSGIATFEAPPSALVSASTTPASGPTALATSLAPWAKLSSAAEMISGTVNSRLTPSRLLSSFGAALLIIGRTMTITARPDSEPEQHARWRSRSRSSCLMPLSAI